MRTVLRRLSVGGCLFLSIAHCRNLSSQETNQPQIDAPSAVADDVPAAADVSARGDSAVSKANDANRWRYKHHQGRWWYWLPSERWVVWKDGRWIDPPTQTIVTDNGGPEYQSEGEYVVPAPSRAARILEPRPRSWYYTGRTYDGPYYYYDEFYEPYGGSRPHPDYPIPRPYPPRYRSSYYGGGYPGYYGYGQPGVGFSIGGGRSAVRIGIGF
jgi:hypothetical protein